MLKQARWFQFGPLVSSAQSGTMAEPLNIVGPQVRRIRYERKLSQPGLAARCQRIGWDISRDTIAKIEAGSRWVGDLELVYLALSLGVGIEELLPKTTRNLLARAAR